MPLSTNKPISELAAFIGSNRKDVSAAAPVPTVPRGTLLPLSLTSGGGGPSQPDLGLGVTGMSLGQAAKKGGGGVQGQVGERRGGNHKVTAR